MSEPFVGEIWMFAGNFAPRGFAFCAGQILAIQQNTALFSLLGTTYGGNGTTTFQLPDLRGRLPVHQGTGSGLSTYVMGEQTGSESVTLLTSEMPQHNHGFVASNSAGTMPIPSVKSVPGVPAGTNASFYSVPGSSAFVISPMAATSVALDGGSQPHENRMPTLTISFIIALQGIFPSRN